MHTSRLWALWAILLSFSCAATAAWAYEIPADFEETLIADHTPETMAAMWYDETAGTNVAAGKQARYLPKPDWSYCIDPNDPWQLTDGVILFTTHDGLSSSQRFNKLRTSPDAVGWDGPATPVHVLIDLGQLYAVRRVVLRYQGGIPGVFDFPIRITLVVSEDGMNFYRVGEYVNEPGPREGPFAHYRMPYLRPYGYYATIFPYVFGELTTKARYVGLEICRRSGLFLDEIAVLEGDFDPAGVQYDEQTRYPFPTTDAALIPRDYRLDIPNNVVLFQNLPAYNDLSAQGTDVRWVIELPAGISLSNEAHQIEPKPDFRTARNNGIYVPFFDQVTQITHDGQPYTRYVFAYGGAYDRGPEGGGTSRVGPLFFETSLPAGSAGTAYVYAQWDGGQQSPLKIPIAIYAMPPARFPQRLHVSLGWLADFYGVAWPDYVNNYRSLGFNVHPVFPRYWDQGLVGYEGAATVMESARAAGLGIVYNESPWSGWLRPAQRDEAYQTELQRLHDRAALTHPDWIFYDVEHLDPYDPTDPDFVARMQEEGLDPDDPDDQLEMALRLGTETYSDMYDAVVSGMTDAGYEAGPAAGRPLCGSFAFDAAEGISYWFDYNRLYPDFLQYSMPSYYYSGDAEVIGYEVADVRRAQGSSDIIPWLSPGGDGEFPSKFMRDQALECFLSGCRGITYWSPQQFDGRDFYYHLQAVNLASKIENIIMDGTVIEADKLSCVGQKLPVKGLELPSGEAAILVSSYRDAQAVPTPVINPPGPGLQVPFTNDLAPATYGQLFWSGGSWSLAGGAATAPDIATWARYEITTEDGTVTSLPESRDWVVRVLYREQDPASTQAFLMLHPDMCWLSGVETNERLILRPGEHLVEVLRTPDGWHTITIHYKSANRRMDLYVDGWPKVRDFASLDDSYMLEGQGAAPDEVCVQVRYQVDAPSDVVDLDTGQLVATITPESPVFEAHIDKATKVFHVRWPVPPDFDRDHDVDMDDFGHLQACFSDTGTPAPSSCADADLNDDGHVDQADLTLFIGCLSAPGVPADLNCEN